MRDEENRCDTGREILREAVGYLEPEDQELFRMYYDEEMTQPKIGKVLGITPPAVQKRRMKLQERLKEIIFQKILARG